MSRSITSTRSLAPICAARSGSSSSSAAAATIAASTSVSVTVSASDRNSAAWRSRTLRRNTLANASPPTIPDTTDATSGRAASSSGFAGTTSSSVIRSAIASRTLRSCSAAVARFANCSDPYSACHAYAVRIAATSSSGATTTSAVTIRGRIAREGNRGGALFSRLAAPCARCR